MNALWASEKQVSEEHCWMAIRDAHPTSYREGFSGSGGDGAVLRLLPAAQSGSTTGTASPDTRSPSPALSLRSCALHTPVSVRYPPVASAHREQGAARVRPPHPRARSGAAPAAADRHHWPVPLLASGPARSHLLPPSLASARQSAGTGARDSKSAIPLQTAPDTLFSTPSFSASVNSRFPSPVLPS